MEKQPLLSPPVHQLYKVHIFGPDSRLKKTVVFSGGFQYAREDIFSEEEIEYIELEGIEIVFSELLIHPDDTIGTVKTKMLGEIGGVAYEEIYLYAKTTRRLHVQTIYENVAAVSSIADDQELSNMQFVQLVKNLEIADAVVAELDKKSSYTYDDLLLLGIDGEDCEINCAVGMRNMEGVDYLFSASPFDIMNTGATRYEPRTQNPLLLFDNELLLNYGPILENNLYCCLAESVYEYSFNRGVDEAYLTSLYYPLLHKRGIRGSTQLVDGRGDLLKTAHLPKDLYQSVDMFYHVFYNKTEEIPYIRRGIQSFAFSIKPLMKTVIPLETVFKQIHATKEMPLIKYNPGLRRENMYRIYSESISKTGKKIPFLSESVMTKLSKDMAKARQISVYLSAADIFVDFEQTGQVIVRGSLKTPLSYGDLNTLLMRELEPFINTINSMLSQPIHKLESIYLDSVSVLGLKYVAVVPLDKLQIKPFLGCISNVFEVSSYDLAKQIQMKFKRVANYVEMDAQSELITKVLRDTNNYQEAAQMLMVNYQMTQEEAIIRIAKYTTEFQELGGRILDNPGFPLIMHAPVGKNQLVVEIDNILSMEYLDVLEIYLDTMLRIILPYRGSNYPLEDITRLCTKTAKTGKKAVAVAAPKSNVVGVTDIAEIKPTRKIQPLNFDFGEDDDMEDLDMGFGTTIGAVTGLSTGEEEEQEEYEEPSGADLDQEDVLDENEEVDDIDLGETNEDGIYIDYDEEVEEEKEPPKDSEVAKSDQDKPDNTETEKEDASIKPEEKEDEGEEDEEESSSEEEEEEEESSSEEEDEEESSSEEEEEEEGEEESTKSDNKDVSEKDEKAEKKEEDVSQEDESEEEEAEQEVEEESTKSDNKDVLEKDEKDNSEKPNEEEEDEEDSDSEGSFFYAGDEEEEEDEEDKPNEKKGGEGTPTQGNNIDGLSLYPNPFLKRLKERDSVLFLTKKEGKYNSYSKSCPSNISRQPIILTDEEKAEIDRTNPGSYSNPVKYGSDPKNQFWYICPRYWCMLTNSSISEEDVKAGKCGSIIPPDAKKVPKGAYVYEFNSRTKEHITTDGKYIEHYPGFLPPDSHPDDQCLPCCFKLQQNAKTQEWEMSAAQKKRRDVCNKPEFLDGPSDGKQEQAADAPGKETNRLITYVKSAAIIPLEKSRWGFLPLSIQLFLKTDNSAATEKTNPSEIRQETPCLLRYGVEQYRNQSFLGCMAEIYAYKQGIKQIPTVAELRNILAKSVTLDQFVGYHNGALVSVFNPSKTERSEEERAELVEKELPKYADTILVKTLKDKKSQTEFILNTIIAYNYFREFLKDANSAIDHTYLWDMVTGYNVKLMRDGINLVILESANNDITNRVEMICPTNSKNQTAYDPRKETVILLKQGEFYEPIYLFEQRKGRIHETKAFIDKPTTLDSIVELLNLVKNVNQSQCLGKPSLPRVYEFEQNISAEQLNRELIDIRYDVVSQVANYQGKIIGLMAKPGESDVPIFIPSTPSKALTDLATHYMDDETLWHDYNITVTRLKQTYVKSGHNIPCLPRMKVLEDGLVVGIITNTQQFVQIAPPSENISPDDGLVAINGSNHFEADKALTLSRTHDTERDRAIKKIALESNFYSAFRSLVQNALNKYANRVIRKTLLTELESNNRIYKQKVEIVVALLRQLLENEVRFAEFKEEDLLDLDEITQCSANCDDPDKKFCLKEVVEADKETGAKAKERCITLIPDKHLISGKKNEDIYYARIADELIRYRRIRRFMFKPNFQLNITDSEYKIDASEFLVLQSTFGTDYFAGLVPFNTNKYVSRINFDIAAPINTQTYNNEISLLEQTRILTQNAADKSYNNLMSECILKQDRVIGNIQNSMWKRIFPSTTEEVVFKPTVFCSYYPIIQVLQERLGTVISIQNVKSFLWQGYSKLLDEYGGKIAEVLKQQGKKEMMDKVAKKRATLEAIIQSEEYYITDLDLWILSRDANLPVVLFSSTKLNQLKLLVDWVLLGGNENDSLYFIRSPAKVMDNTPPEYHLILGKYKYIDLKEFRKAMQTAIAARDTDEHLIPLTKFLNIKNVVIKRKAVPK